MISQNTDGNRQQSADQHIDKRDQSQNSLEFKMTNEDQTVHKRDKKQLMRQHELGLERIMLSHFSSDNYKFDQKDDEQDKTVNKRFRKQTSQLCDLNENSEKTHDTSVDYFYEGQIFQQNSDVVSSFQFNAEDFDNIGKMNISRKKNNDFNFSDSNQRNQHKILTKQLENMKSKCVRNGQLNNLDSKKEKNEDDEIEAEYDDDEDEDDGEFEQDHYQKNEEQESQDHNKQRSWKKRLANDYLILEILGKGGQGKVATFLDKKNNQIIALKEFSQIKEFDRESMIYQFLQEQTDLHDYVNLMLDENRSQKQIKLQMGSCSLYEMYIQMKNQNAANKQQISWDEDQLIKIFRQLLRGLIAFRKKHFFHGDIKPHNLMMFLVENVYNHYTIKYIDLGAAGFENRDYYELYSEQFYQPEYLEKVVMNEYVLTDTEVNICELYAIIRSMWIILCFQKEDVNDFKANTDLEFGIKFISSQYPNLGNLVQKILNQNGDLTAIEQIINEDQCNGLPFTSSF